MQYYETALRWRLWRSATIWQYGEGVVKWFSAAWKCRPAPSAASYCKCYTTTTLSGNTWDGTELQAVLRQVFSQPAGAHTHTHRRTLTMKRHELPGVGSQTGQLNTHKQHTHAHTPTQIHRRTTSRRGDNLCPGRTSTKWCRGSGVSARILGRESGADCGRMFARW